MGRKSDAELSEAFAADGYRVDAMEHHQGSRGILARSIADPSRTALYLEGDHFTQGYLTGLLACDDVERMAGEFVDNVVEAFVTEQPAHPLRLRHLKRLLLNLVKKRCLEAYRRRPDDIPRPLQEEIKGIAAGCRMRHHRTSATHAELFLLNTGVDFLLSHVYTGAYRFDWIPKLAGREGLARRLAVLLSPRRPAAGELRLPLGCNAFSISSRYTEGAKHYLGRDFMFPTAGVFQDTCCVVVRAPADAALSTAGLSAPGLVGYVTAMSSAGVGLGVDMVAGQNCDPHRPGLNSLLLLRAVSEHARSLDEAVAVIRTAPRGVSWLYVVADGDRDTAVVVEAGARDGPGLDVESVPEPYRSLIGTELPPGPQPRMAVRTGGYRVPPAVAALNARLFAAAGFPYDPSSEAPGARFHTAAEKPWKRHAVPGPFYFAPARIQLPDVLVACNQYLTPQMRLASMGAWISLLSRGHEDDFQWRSDELSGRVLTAVTAAQARGRGLDLDEVKALIDFLSPLGSWTTYYERSASTARGTRIEGAISVCDLTARVLHAYFGAYDGGWLRLTLPAYVP